MRAPVPLDVREVVTEPVTAVLTCVTVETDAAKLSTAMSVAIGRLTQYVQRHALQVVGAPRAIYTAYGDHRTTFTVAFPIAAPDAASDALAEAARASTPHIRIGELAPFTGFRFVHVGAHADLPSTYARITQWLLAHGHIESEHDWAHLLPMWEEYVSDPARTPAHALITHLYVPRLV